MSKSTRARSSKPRAGFKARSKVGRKAAGHHHRRVHSKQARVLTLLRRPSGGVRRSQGAAMHPAPPPPGHSGRPACYPTNGTLFLQGAANRADCRMRANESLGRWPLARPLDASARRPASPSRPRRRDHHDRHLWLRLRFRAAPLPSRPHCPDRCACDHARHRVRHPRRQRALRPR
jgi:hypothetical protein